MGCRNHETQPLVSSVGENASFVSSATTIPSHSVSTPHQLARAVAIVVAPCDYFFSWEISLVVTAAEIVAVGTFCSVFP